jgi:hypothetical protein
VNPYTREGRWTTWVEVFNAPPIIVKNYKIKPTTQFAATTAHVLSRKCRQVQANLAGKCGCNIGVSGRLTIVPVFSSGNLFEIDQCWEIEVRNRDFRDFQLLIVSCLHVTSSHRGLISTPKVLSFGSRWRLKEMPS